MVAVERIERRLHGEPCIGRSSCRKRVDHGLRKRGSFQQDGRAWRIERADHVHVHDGTDFLARGRRHRGHELLAAKKTFFLAARISAPSRLLDLKGEAAKWFRKRNISATIVVYVKRFCYQINRDGVFGTDTQRACGANIPTREAAIFINSTESKASRIFGTGQVDTASPKWA
jgi:hypothetical protein